MAEIKWKMDDKIIKVYQRLNEYDSIFSDNNDIDIIVECIINGYIKIYGNEIYIPIEIIKILGQYYGNISESNIINKTHDWICFMNMILKQLNKTGIILRKIYDTDIDGFRAETFHTKCDNKGPTLCIIKNEYDYIFGGYTKISWNNPSQYMYKSDPNAFLYNYYPKQKIYPIRLKTGMNAVRHQNKYGLSFGNGCDLIIYDNCNVRSNSNSNRPSIYSFKQYEITSKRNFIVSHIEVFTCNIAQ